MIKSKLFSVNHLTAKNFFHLFILFLYLYLYLSYIYACIYIIVSEKEMAAQSSVLAWRIPWTEEPSGLRSMGHKLSNMTERWNHHHHIVSVYLIFLSLLLVFAVSAWKIEKKAWSMPTFFFSHFSAGNFLLRFHTKYGLYFK